MLPSRSNRYKEVLGALMRSGYTVSALFHIHCVESSGLVGPEVHMENGGKGEVPLTGMILTTSNP